MAIQSLILNSGTKTTSTTKPKGKSITIDSLKNIQQILIKKGKVRKEILDKKSKFTSQRKEKEQRKRREEELEATNLVIKPSGPIQMIQSSTKGFLERLLGSLAYLTSGWLMNNLPTWIAMGKEFIGRVQKMGQLIGGFMTNVKNIFTGFGNLLSATFQNLIQFDLFDSSNRVKDAFGQLTGSVDNMGKELEEAIRLITTPLTEGMVTGENAPPTGEQRTYEGAYEPAGTMQGGGADFWTLSAVAALEDGDPQGRADVAQSIYNRASSGIFGSTSIKAIILSGNGKQYEPVGRAVKQFRSIQDRESAIVAIMTANKLSRSQAERMIDDTVSAITNPSLRQKAAEFVENRTDFLGSGLTPSRKSSTDLRRRNPSDNVFGNYVGPASYQYGLKTRGQASPVPNIQTPSTQISQVPPRKINPIVGDRLGAGRNHGGTDLAVNNGTPLRAVSDGVIVDSDYEKGWGNFLVMKDNLGIYHLYGHMQSGYKRSGPVKKGEIIGKVGMTGRTTGPHLHWESGTGWNGSRITGRFDPLDKYSKFAPFNTPYSGKPTPSLRQLETPTPPAQIESTKAQQRQQLSQQLAQERRGQTVIVQQPSEPELQSVQYVSGGSQAESLTIDEFTLVNNFIRNKLLLDLAYL